MRVENVLLLVFLVFGLIAIIRSLYQSAQLSREIAETKKRIQKKDEYRRTMLQDAINRLESNSVDEVLTACQTLGELAGASHIRVFDRFLREEKWRNNPEIMRQVSIAATRMSCSQRSWRLRNPTTMSETAP